MQIDFTTKTSDELRELIAAGIFPPIAGADGEGETVETEAPAEEATPSMDDIVNRASASANAEVEEAEEPEAETPAEAEETPEPVESDDEIEEGDDEIVDAETINAAVQIATDPDHELYEDAVNVLRDFAPAIAESLGFDAEDGDYEGPELTGDPQIDSALEYIADFRREQEQQTQAQQERAAQEAADQAMAAFRSDLTELAGDDVPESYEDMDANQKLFAVGLLGIDGMGDDPKVELQELLAERDKQIEQAAIDKYVAGKSDYKPTPAVERTGATTSTHPQTPSEGTTSLAGIISKHAGAQNGVSG